MAGLSLLQPILHYGGHWLVPFAIAAIVWPEKWLRAGLVIAAANMVDIDHMLADPIFDPERCSIGFHPLHSWIATLTYAMMFCIPRWWVRALALGALWHLAVDWGDCQFMAL